MLVILFIIALLNTFIYVGGANIVSRYMDLHMESLNIEIIQIFE